MPETVHPDSYDAADPEPETEDVATEQAEEAEENDEPEFFIPAPGGLRGL